MKLKTLKNKLPQVKSLKKKADKLASDYQKASAVASAAEGKKTEINLQIKNLAAVAGVKDGTKTIVEGNDFLIGFNSIKMFFLDKAEAKKLLDAKLYESILADPAIDKDKFQKAVDDGRIKREDANVILKEGTPQIRLVVIPKRSNARP